MTNDVLARFQSAFSSSKDSDEALVTARDERRQAILDGDFPTLRELLCGLPFCRGEVHFDARLWARNELLRPCAANEVALFEQLQAVADHATRFTIAAIDVRLLPYSEHRRRTLYLAMLGDELERRSIASILFSGRYQTWLEDIYATALALSIIGMPPVEDNDEALVPSDGASLGLIRLRQLEMSRLDAAMDAQSSANAPAALDDLGLPPLANARDIDDNLSEDTVEGPTAIVVPAFSHSPVAGGKDRKSNRDGFKGIAGRPLRLITRGNVAGHRTALVGRSPHLQPVIDTILGDLSTREIVRFRPTILVGEPGVGKSAIARDICKQIGLPMTVYGAGGVADGSFGGTPAQWSTSGPAVPLLLVRDFEVGNPVIIVDEVDKAGTGHTNGNLHDALLGFLDRGNAAEFRDPSLEVTVDLSHVNWLLTANSLADISAPLRDRCRILQVPNPEWRHVGDLARSIIADLARERELGEGWIQPLAGDELEVVRKAWAGGSIRRLRRVIETLITGRDQIMARC